ncbi:FAD-NAD(P)-binding [Corynebacterium mycetoides]|uniref:FAD-NAD(P)-binding n=1 Tax=Corynebacterium mycetoides TaxID=38302 RepID=A0A1G9QL42_9CORY|nr:FAD/NAD(P)-binding protein [Corynebacterium mycetoides]SDM11706.1 FAD-NAD(P)-binding [Corynebacterium mycetoides]
MQADIALVGMGPRGISTVERIASYLDGRPPKALTLHLIDDAEIGAGRVWETDQTRTLCMNTLAGAVTLFTEPGSTVGGRVLEGPTMFEWIQLIRGERDAVASPARSLYDAHPADPARTERFAAEIAATRTESNPSRALYGEYLRWVFDVALAQLPDYVTVRTHRARAVGITEDGGRDRIELDDGSTVTADATVLSTGWVLPARSAPPSSGGVWVAPDNPVEQDTAALAPGEAVLVRGLGMGFFDLMALITIDRGGRFVPDASARSGLSYVPSGREPRIVVTSGRGYPYLPKSEYHSLPPAGTLERHRAVLSELASEHSPIAFGTRIWPALVRDAYAAYYRTLARVRPNALRRGLDEIVGLIDAADVEPVASAVDISLVPAALNDALRGSADADFDLNEWIDPLRGTDGLGIGELGEYIASRMERDIAEAVAAWDSPVKAALWEISTARKPTTIAVENGRGAEEDRLRALREFLAFGQMVGSGPPLFRTRELLALYDAGIIRFLGGQPVLSAADPGFTATSATRRVTAPVLADAFLPGPDVRRPADPLTRSLLDARRIRPFAPHGVPTAAPETDAATRRAVRADGTLDPRLHIAGIPTGGQWADTTISPMPGTDAPFLQETDAVAASLLSQSSPNPGFGPPPSA